LKSNGEMSDKASLTSTNVEPQTHTTPSSSRCAFNDLDDDADTGMEVVSDMGLI
jgi:hypothetical protein